MKSQEEVKRFITDGLPHHPQCVVATTDDTGQPWAVCVAFGHDNQFNIFWRSVRDTEHSRHLRARPDIAICIFSDTDERGEFGLYLKAKAHEVTDPAEAQRLLEHLAARKNRSPEDPAKYQNPSPLRLYYATVTAAWINDDSHVKTPVDLEVLRHA